MNYRKLLLIVLFLLTVVGIGLLIYILFFKTPIGRVVSPTPQPVATSTTGTGQLPFIPSDGTSRVVDVDVDVVDVISEIPPETAISQLVSTSTVVLDKNVAGIILDRSSKDLLYYNRSDGKFYRMTDKGDAVLLTDQQFYDVQKIEWSPDKKKAILEYPDQSKIIYNFVSKEQVSLQKHWQEVTFSPDSSKIAFKSIGLDKGNRWLAIGSVDGGNVQQIEHLSNDIDTINVEWSPNKQIIATFAEGIDFDRQNLYFVGLHGENFKATILPGRGFKGQWTPTGDRLLYSVHRSDTGNKPELWIVDATPDSIGINRHRLNVGTWADKCSFKDNNNIICAVPQTLEEGVGYVPAIADTVPDDIYQINLTTGVKTLVTTLGQPHTIKDIFINQDAQSLYFTDKNDGRLYKVEL